jgi:hypothetical protein
LSGSVVEVLNWYCIPLDAPISPFCPFCPLGPATDESAPFCPLGPSVPLDPVAPLGPAVLATQFNSVPVELNT